MQFCAVYAVSLYATAMYAEAKEQVIFVKPETNTRTFDVTDTREFETGWN